MLWWRVRSERRRSAASLARRMPRHRVGRTQRRAAPGSHDARAIATPSQPLRSRVCSAVASKRGSRPSISRPRCGADDLRMSVVAGLATSPARPMLSTTTTVPGWPESRGPVEVERVRLLVGVDEDQVERRSSPARVGSTCSPRPMRMSTFSPDARRGRRSRGRPPRCAGSASIVTTTPSSGIAARHPDRRVGAERADLEHPPGAGDAREQVQQLARDGRDLDRGEPARVLLRDRRLEVGVVTDERLGQVRVDAAPAVGRGFGHGASQPASRARVNRRPLPGRSDPRPRDCTPGPRPWVSPAVSPSGCSARGQRVSPGA